jgi:hypothetical protein
MFRILAVLREKDDTEHTTRVERVAQYVQRRFPYDYQVLNIRFSDVQPSQYLLKHLLRFFFNF